RLDGRADRQPLRVAESLVVLELLRAAHLSVGALVDVGDEVVEGVLDRRREHEGPGDERDAEDHGDRREQEAQLVCDETLAGHLRHGQLPASRSRSSRRIRSRIASGCGSASSSVTRPSARNTTRLAYDAAEGSWVTMTIVWPKSSTARFMNARISAPAFESR